MSNPYVNVSDLTTRIDFRSVFRLSNDAQISQPDLDNLNTLLDDSASEFESYIDQRYSVANVRDASPMPNIIKRWICNRAIYALYARRGIMPKEIEAQIRLDTEWMEKIISGRINLPTIPRAAAPVLVTSSRPDGSSRFDYDFGQVPSPAGPTQGGPSQPQGIPVGGPYPRNMD